MAGTPVSVDGRTFSLTNPDKVLYPATGTTKAEVLDYYRAIAPVMVPHLAGRPATRKRWVHGVGTPAEPQPAFFAKNLDAGTPDWVRSARQDHGTSVIDYPVIDEPATLVWLAQLAALEIHVPQWRFAADGTPANPDRLVLDLDPGDGADLEHCVELAQLLREILDGVGLPTVPVTSGSKGIHLYAGLDGTLSAAAASELAQQLALMLEADRPDLVIATQNKAARAGRVLLDWSQNNGSKTTVSPYSLRGVWTPQVATPRSWDEIVPGLRHVSFREALDRVHTFGDLLAPLLPTGASAQQSPAAPAPAASQVDASPAPASERARVVVEGPDAADAEPEGSGLDGVPVFTPMLATLGSQAAIRHGAWHYEIKWDGYRGLGRAAGGAWSLTSRNGLDYTASYPELSELAALAGQHALAVDGEIVALGPDGRPSFELLQNHAVPLHYMLFDLLWIDGESLLDRPYVERRARLEDVFGEGGERVKVPTTFGTDQELALTLSRELALEGVIAKRPTSRYLPGGRSSQWLKIKHVRHAEVVVVGWSPGEGSRAHTLGSVLLATVESGRLIYAGRAGSGFTDRALTEALARLNPLERATPPLEGVPAKDARGVHWVEPVLVGEVKYGERSSSGVFRHPVWRGWRPDKAPADLNEEG